MKEAIAYKLGKLALFFFRVAVNLSRWFDPYMIDSTILKMADQIKADNKMFDRQKNYWQAVKKTKGA
jgi:hypothetical protein